MRDGIDLLDRRDYLRAAGVATLGSVGLSGCVGRASGTLATGVTDQPADIGDFESLVVTIEGIWLGPEGAESGADEADEEDGDEDDDEATDETNEEDDEDDGDGNEDDGEMNEEDDGEMNGEDDGEMNGEDDETDGEEGNSGSGREYHAFDEPQQADLVELQDDTVQLIDERELDVATYRFLQLDVTDTAGTLADGDEATVELPGQAPLTFNAEFEIREDTRTSFTADFAPVRRGGTGTYLLRPVPSGIEVSYEEVSE